MIEGDYKTNGIAKIFIRLRRKAGVKELLQKLADERKNESVSITSFIYSFLLHILAYTTFLH